MNKIRSFRAKMTYGREETGVDGENPDDTSKLFFSEHASALKYD
jgi:hypothetical protein